MRFAVDVEGGAPPIGVSLNQPQARDARHQVHFAGGDQAANDGGHVDPLWGELDVVLLQQLRHGVVAGDIQVTLSVPTVSVWT